MTPISGLLSSITFIALIIIKFYLALWREAVITFQNTQCFSSCVNIKSRTVSELIHSEYFQRSAVCINILNVSKLTMSGFTVDEEFI
jgi:hypothetical protein